MTIIEERDRFEVEGRGCITAATGRACYFFMISFCPTWLPLHDSLAANYEVFVPIHPGFAGSEDDFDEFEEMEDLVFHYLDFCEVLDLDRPALAGASFGGWIAAEWAMRYSETIKKSHPHRCIGIALRRGASGGYL